MNNEKEIYLSVQQTFAGQERVTNPYERLRGRRHNSEKVSNYLTTTLLLPGPRESQQKDKENLNSSQFVKELVENKLNIVLYFKVTTFPRSLLICFS